MTPPKSCYLLDAADIEARIDELCDVLTDCVTHGASVSFLLPFEQSKARAFWHGVAQSVERGERLLLAVDNASGVLVGTVQLILSNRKTNLIARTSRNFSFTPVHVARG